MAVSREDHDGLKDNEISSVEIPEKDGDEMGIEIPPIDDPRNIVQLGDYKYSKDQDLTSTVEIPRAKVKTETLIERKRVSEDLKPYLKEQVDNMLSEHKQEKEQRIAKGFEKNSNQAWDELMEKAPTFNNEELKNKQGEIVDFDLVSNYQELIDKLEKEGEIVNQLGQRVPAETIINDIFKLTYQDLNDFTNEDWTRIPLNHNLRKAVARLIREYKESKEFKMLGGLDWYRINTVSGLKKEILKRKVYGEVNSDVLLRHIEENNLDALPEMLKYRVQEVKNLSSMEVVKRSVGGTAKRAWGKVKSWFK